MTTPTPTEKLEEVEQILRALLELRNLKPEARRRLEHAVDSVINVHCEL